MNRLLPLLTLLCWSYSLQSQSSLNQGGVVQPIFHDTIPFEYIRGKMLVKLEIGGKLRKFFLDTGAPCAVFDYLQQEIGAEVTNRDSITDATGGISELDWIVVKSFRFGQLEFRDIPALVLREQVGSFLKCWGADGIIGSNALRNCILQIDLKAKHLILSNELPKLDLSDSSTVPLYLNEHQSDPYLELTLGEDHVNLANFDTGSPEAFAISIEDAAIPLERQSAHLINVGYGKMTLSITDSQQEQWFRDFAFDTLTIGATRFLNFTSIPSAEQNFSLVGIGLGEFGIITVDYLNKQFHFQNYEKGNLVTAEKHTTAQGFSIHPAEDGYVIGIVWNDSPAARLGLKSGYKVSRIEGVDFSKRTSTLDCELIIWSDTPQDVTNIEYIDDEGKTVSLSIGKN